MTTNSNNNITTLYFVTIIIKCIYGLDITHGCVDTAIAALSGVKLYHTENKYRRHIHVQQTNKQNYSKIHTCNQHSLWIKNVSIGEVYVIYFSQALTSTLEGFGFWRCDNAETYLNQIDLADCQSPGTIMGCVGYPTIYCPTLSDQDLSYMIDGGGADTNLQFLDISDFYNCSHWFIYDDSSAYDSNTKMTFTYPNEWCISMSDSNSNSDNIPSGDNTHNISGDSIDSKGMNSSQKAILWTLITIFIIICIAAIGLIEYRWRKKKLRQETQLGSALLFDT